MARTSRRVLVGCAAAISLLAACGGGGGYGGGSTSGGSQQTPAAVDVRTAVLTAAQEGPSVTSAGSGTGAVVVDRTTKAITGGITFAGLTPTAAHIHQGRPGVSGAVAIGLVLGTDTATVPANTTLTDAQYAALLAGELYFNVHTAANPGGEIRGQLTGQGGVVAGLGTLNGAQEIPAPGSPTTGSGVGTVVVDSTTHEILVGVVTYSGLTSTANNSHIHEAAPGASGPVRIGLNLNTGASVATAAAGATMTDAQYTALLAGNLYFNVHTVLNAAGEIRGQIAVQTQSAAGMVPTLASIQANVFTPSCALSGCHNGAGAQQGLRLDAGFSSASLVNIPSSQDSAFTRVIPGDPNNSLIIQKLEGTQTVGVRMPFGGPYLAQGTINVIRQWIVTGAAP